jgi:predicted MPP superfamily phosphohydrolase
LPGETVPNLSDKETKNALRKPRPKFLFSSNDDLKVTEENSPAKKKALLSQSFSHSF